MLQIFRSKYEHIERFQIYGERHSGTNFLEKTIKTVFNLPMTSFFGHKHWMGFAKPERIAYERHTLFLGIIRNPYDWLLALYDLPHHIPHHNRYNIEGFLLNEHYSIDYNADTEILHDRNFMTLEKRRYRNIFELRKTKLIYLNEILPELASNYVFVSYENFLADHNKIVNIISSRFNLTKYNNAPAPKPIFHRGFPGENIKNIMTNNICWDIEKMVGYAPR
jgi:hypothetical protein